MKKILNKEVLIAFIIGIILASSIAVYATMNANQVTYKNGKNVEQALNELYANQKNNTGIDGYYQFVKGNNGFTETKGQMEFTSLGVSPKTYEDTGDANCSFCAIEKILDTPIKLKNKFELSTQLFINNSSSSYGGSIVIRLCRRNGDGYDEISNLRLNDAWNSSTQISFYSKFNNIELSQGTSYTNAWTTTNASGRYALIGDGSKIYIYRGDILIASTDCILEGEIQIDKIEIESQCYKSAFTALPKTVEDVYVGKPLFYKSIIGE